MSTDPIIGGVISSTTTISCDQVVWLGDVLERYSRALKTVDRGIGRLPEAAKLAALLEIMEVLHLKFEDLSAQMNAMSIMKFGE